eukprot:701074-Ditylum_brightwellii.AAC.1
MQWVDFQDAKEDHPSKMAQYIANYYTPRSRREGMDCVCFWAKKNLRDLDRAVRRVAKLYDFYLDDKEHVRK